MWLPCAQPGFSTDVLLWVPDNECWSRLQRAGCQALLCTRNVDTGSATWEAMVCYAVGWSCDALTLAKASRDACYLAAYFRRTWVEQGAGFLDVGGNEATVPGCALAVSNVPTV